MFRHYIILSSSYTQGTRIALDYVDLSEKQTMAIRQLPDKIKNECGEGVSISTHCVGALDSDWASVGKADPFFADVKLISSEEEFIRLIKQDRTLKGLDVAKYILSVIPCTHLKLEKLTYLCYADYLCATNGIDRLFKDSIYAYRYGPVVDSVYEYYKRYAGAPIEEKELPERKYILSARSRILFSERGLKKLNSIMETLERYKNYSAGELIDITHRKGSPWTHCDSSAPYEPIPDEVILKNHCIEK